MGPDGFAIVINLPSSFPAITIDAGHWLVTVDNAPNAINTIAFGDSTSIVITVIDQVFPGQTLTVSYVGGQSDLVALDPPLPLCVQLNFPVTIQPAPLIPTAMNAEGDGSLTILWPRPMSNSFVDFGDLTAWYTGRINTIPTVTWVDLFTCNITWGSSVGAVHPDVADYTIQGDVQDIYNNLADLFMAFPIT